MKVCFFGLGSIGKRHIRNLYAVCQKRGIPLEVTALRSSNAELPPEIKNMIKREVSNSGELDSKYDVIFITNPTSLHHDTLCDHIDRSDNFFIEKPVFDKCHELPFLRENGTYYVACPLRYSGVIKDVKELVDKGERPFSIRIICSSYLPDWRPGTDYRQSYSAKKELGGGVSIDLIHEIDYVTYLFGLPAEVVSTKGKYSALEIDSDDLAVYILKYKDKVVEIHLDYFGRIPRRKLEVYCNDKVIIGNLLKNEITINGKNISTIFEEQPNDKYIREMEYFLDCVQNGKKTHNEISNAQNILNIARS